MGWKTARIGSDGRTTRRYFRNDGSEILPPESPKLRVESGADWFTWTGIGFVALLITGAIACGVLTLLGVGI